MNWSSCSRLACVIAAAVWLLALPPLTDALDASTVCNGVADVDAGFGHTCAIAKDATVRCWGLNTEGQLGNGDNAMILSYLPVMVTGLTNVLSIAAGDSHTCAVLNNGTVHCWGWNSNGQLGDGNSGDTSATSNVPVKVNGLSNVRSIASGQQHTCAVLNNGTAWCWGWNGYGQLGDGSTASRSEPVMVSGLANVSSIAAGDAHTCAVLDNDTATCWGANFQGQLGDGTTTTSGCYCKPAPVLVSGLSNVRSIAVGTAHTCAVLNNNTATCWGSNYNGQLGDGSATNSGCLCKPDPVSVSGLSNVRNLAMGQLHTCAVLENGTASCWGINYFGQLGDGSIIERHAPVAVLGLSNVHSIATGNAQTCAVLEDGTAHCWGYNQFGQLGDGSTINMYQSVEMVCSCTGEPSKFSPPLPDNSAWSCSGSTDGSTCAAICIEGYAAADTTSWTSTCGGVKSGIWGTPDASISQTKLTCSPNPCSKTDPTDENSLVVLPSHATWVCTGKAHGDVCTATCGNGYHQRSGTSWQSTCTAGHWPAPAVSTAGDTALVCDPNGRRVNYGGDTVLLTVSLC